MKPQLFGSMWSAWNSRARVLAEGLHRLGEVCRAGLRRCRRCGRRRGSRSRIEQEPGARRDCRARASAGAWSGRRRAEDHQRAGRRRLGAAGGLVLEGSRLLGHAWLPSGCGAANRPDNPPQRGPFRSPFGYAGAIGQRWRTRMHTHSLEPWSSRPRLPGRPARAARAPDLGGGRADRRHHGRRDHRRHVVRLDGAGRRRLAHVDPCGGARHRRARLSFRPTARGGSPLQLRHRQVRGSGGLRQRDHPRAHRAADRRREPRPSARTRWRSASGRRSRSPSWGSP